MRSQRTHLSATYGTKPTKCYSLTGQHAPLRRLPPCSLRWTQKRESLSALARKA